MKMDWKQVKSIHRCVWKKLEVPVIHWQSSHILPQADTEVEWKQATSNDNINYSIDYVVSVSLLENKWQEPTISNDNHKESFQGT